MNGMAHVSFEGGGLIVPAQTPYERQLLCEHAEASTRQHGSVQLSLNGRLWTLSLNAGAREVCATCAWSLGNLSYRFDGQTLCARCARRAMH